MENASQVKKSGSNNRSDILIILESMMFCSTSSKTTWKNSFVNGKTRNV